MDDPTARERSAAQSVAVLVPEGASPLLDAAFRAHLNRKLAKPHAMLLGRLLLAVGEFLPMASADDLPHLAKVVETALIMTLSPEGQKRAAAEQGDARASLRNQVEAVIEDNISSARLSAARIAQLAGISRSTLYRTFEGNGGVAAHVQRIRLARVRSALQDPGERSVPIATIAERHGFHSVASFNRAFRRTYGTTPRKLRAEAIDQGWFPLPDGAVPRRDA